MPSPVIIEILLLLTADAVLDGPTQRRAGIQCGHAIKDLNLSGRYGQRSRADSGCGLDCQVSNTKCSLGEQNTILVLSFSPPRLNDTGII